MEDEDISRDESNQKKTQKKDGIKSWMTMTTRLCITRYIFQISRKRSCRGVSSLRNPNSKTMDYQRHWLLDKLGLGCLMSRHSSTRKQGRNSKETRHE